MKITARLFLAPLLVAISLSSPARADSEHQHYMAGYGGHENHYARQVQHSDAVFRDRDRDVIARYGDRQFRRCGDHDCFPAGHFHHYGRGEFIPRVVVYEPLPSEVVVQMTPAPYGTQYVRVDDNVYLIDTATREVLDAALLLSAVH